jgi:Leucine-rich repeat (LRR) protein
MSMIQACSIYLLQKVIGNLTHLQKLNLSKNHVKGLPENIGNLINLKYLDLSNNQIATLPITIGNLKNLKHLDLRNNPLAQKFSEIVGTPCQNESQCQQAARNVLKAFSSNTDGDKKKKQNAGMSCCIIENSNSVHDFKK